MSLSLIILLVLSAWKQNQEKQQLNYLINNKPHFVIKLKKVMS